MGAVPQRASILTLGEGFAESVAGASKHGSTPRSRGGVWQEGFLPHPSPGGLVSFWCRGTCGGTAASPWARPSGPGTNKPGTGVQSRGMGTGWEGLPSPSGLAALHVIFGSQRERILISKTKVSQCKLKFRYIVLFPEVSGR